MTYYVTDTTTGEMTELLDPLRHKPRGKVRRMPQTRHKAHQTTYHPRRQYKRVNPFNDLLSGLAALLIAFAVLAATAH